MITRFIKLNCRDDVNFLHVLPGRALAEDLREPPLHRRMPLLRRRRARPRRLEAVAVAAVGIHHGGVTRSRRGGIASGRDRGRRKRRRRRREESGWMGWGDALGEEAEEEALAAAAEEEGEIESGRCVWGRGEVEACVCL
ncbi:Os06g0563250, partial [Oryza sativa Japonica Group]